jgi:hypothetical protein
MKAAAPILRPMPLSIGSTSLAVLAALSLFPVPQPQTPDFRPLEFLVGSCWKGTFPDGKATDQHCFEWVFDRKFIRDRHVVRNGEGPYSGETLYGWDPEEKRLGFWSWNSEGEILTGAVEYGPGSIVFPTKHVTEKGTLELRATWTRTGPDSYRVEQSRRAGDAWKPLWAMELKRVSDGAS